MDPLRLFLRMARLARHPPSARHVRIGLVVLALAAALFAVESLGWWPEALTLDRARPPRVLSP